jgi:hypothetical protein
VALFVFDAEIRRGDREEQLVVCGEVHTAGGRGFRYKFQVLQVRSWHTK